MIFRRLRSNKFLIVACLALVGVFFGQRQEAFGQSSPGLMSGQTITLDCYNAGENFTGCGPATATFGSGQYVVSIDEGNFYVAGSSGGSAYLSLCVLGDEVPVRCRSVAVQNAGSFTQNLNPFLAGPGYDLVSFSALARETAAYGGSATYTYSTGYHLECVNYACEQVQNPPGTWFSNCSTYGAACGNPKHLECVSDACTSVADVPGGNNTDKCSTNADCAPTTKTLTVTVSGSGSVSDNFGNSCSSTCSKNYPINTAVTLTATGSNGATFTSWGGDCAGVTGSTCTGTMSVDHNVSATFTGGNPTHSVCQGTTCARVSGSGSNQCSSNADCGGGGGGGGPVINMSCDPGSVSPGGSAQVSWSSPSAVTCSGSDGASGWSGTSGSQSTGNLFSNTTYTITCSK